MKHANAPRNFSPEQAVRLRHYQGERLTGHDLQDEYDNEAWLRGLHVVALHDTWGIAQGFEVALRGPRVRVAPGFAYDCFGREIILSDRQLLTLPPEVQDAPAGFDLIMRFDGAPPDRQPARDSPLCPRPCDQPAFVWQRAELTRPGLDVPLLRIIMLDGEPALDLDIRRYTQPLARPHVENGITPLTQVWTLWRFGEVLFLQTDVSTADGGFVGTPFYTATLSFHAPTASTNRSGNVNAAASQDTAGFAHMVLPPEALVGVQAGDDPGRTLVPYLFTGIAFPYVAADGSVASSSIAGGPAEPAAPSATGFTFRITLDATREQLSSPIIRALINLHDGRQTAVHMPIPFMRVAWLGVEPGSSCNRRGTYSFIGNAIHRLREEHS